MESATFDLYRDIAERTDGDVYLGVVGPVRTGKSTFITRLMELLVMPKIPEGARKERIADELPQSGSGRTIMTTHNQALYRIARAVIRNDSEAEDVVQEAYVRAFSHLDSFRGEATLSTFFAFSARS